MPTYSKETALYDTGAIAAGIDAAGDTADTYITAVDQNGITVHPARSNWSTTGGRTNINASGMTVYVGSDDVAFYGATARIGKSNSDRVTVDSTNGITIYKGNSKRLQTTANGIAMYGSDGTDNIVAQFGADGAQIGYVDTAHAEIDSNSLRFVARSAGVGPFFRVADETDENGFVRLVNSFTGDGTTTDFNLDPAPSMVPPEQYVTTVKVNGSTVPFTLELTSGGFVYVELAQAPASGAGIIVTYWCNVPVAPTLSFGQSLSNVVRGIGSISLGDYTTAEQSHSIAIGHNASSYAEGAVAIGESVYARGENQAVLGKNNANDPDHALEVGNGVGSWARSNAFAVGWDGTVTTARDILVTSTSNMSGIITAGSGITIDIFKFCQRSNVASILLRAKKSTVTAANTAISVGTVVADRCPPFECAGPGTSGVGDCWIDETGSVKFRSTSQIAANANFYVRVTYPVA